MLKQSETAIPNIPKFKRISNNIKLK